jgi:hypothetical protein
MTQDFDINNLLSNIHRIREMIVYIFELSSQYIYSYVVVFVIIFKFDFVTKQILYMKHYRIYIFIFFWVFEVFVPDFFQSDIFSYANIYHSINIVNPS